MWTSVFVSVVFGWILLLAVTFAIPDTQASIDTANELLPIVPFIWAESMSQQWAECPAVHLRRRAVLLRHGVDDVRVADDVRVLARPRRAGPSALASSREEPRPEVVGALRRVLVAAILMVPAIWNYFIGYCGGNGDRGDRPLHRVHHSGLSSACGRATAGTSRAPGASDDTTSGSTSSRSSGSCLITILFIFPLYTVGLPWNDPFDWQFTNYTILWFAGIGLIFGGWWALSAKNWFKGPVRMGTEEELERLEEEQLGEFALPTEAT